MLAQSAKANLQETLPFLKMNPQNNQDFENDPPAKCPPPPPSSAPSQVVNQPLRELST